MGCKLGPFVVVARKMGILTAQRVAQRVVGLISLYFLARYLVPANLGHYQFAEVALGAWLSSPCRGWTTPLTLK